MTTTRGYAHLDENNTVPLDEIPSGLNEKLDTPIDDLLSSFLQRTGYGFTSPGTSKQIYVATTGNDITGDGSFGAPYATIQKALDVIASTIYQGAYNIYVADGTYTENLEAVPVMNAAGITGYGEGHIHIIGNIFDPTAVIIKPATGINFISNNGLCRTILDSLTLEGTNGQSTIGIAASSGRVILKDVILKNLLTSMQVYGDAYVQSLSFSDLTIETNQSGSAGILCEENSITEFLGSVDMSGITNDYITVQKGGVFVHRFGTLTMTGTAGTEYGLIVDKDGVAYVSSFWTFDTIRIGFDMRDRGTLYLTGGSFVFDGLSNGVKIGEMSVLLADNSSFNYAGGTPTEVDLYPGALLVSSNILGGATLVYQSGTSNRHHGYDIRYQTVVAGHATGTLPSAATNYLTQAAVQAGIYQLYVATENEQIEELRIRMETASGAAKTDTFTVVKNGVDTSMTLGITNQNSASTSSNKVSLSQGDRVAIKVASASSTAAANIIAQLKIRKRTN